MFSDSILPHCEATTASGQKWVWPLCHFFSCPRHGQTLQRHSVCTTSSKKHACALAVPGAGPLEHWGLGYTGIWAPLQGPLCHFLVTFKHTVVVRWGRPVKAQPCWEPSTASEERRQPLPWNLYSHSFASNSQQIKIRGSRPTCSLYR